MTVLAFSIKTIPDIDGSRRLYDLHGLSDEDVAKAVLHKRRQQANSEVLRHHLHRIVAISAVLTTADQFKVWSLGDEHSSEQDLLQRFFEGIARYTPTLVSWNGIGFDLPVIHYRSLLYPVNAHRYWDSTSQDGSLQVNNYRARFDGRHTDLRDVLSGYQPQAALQLREMASLCGFPGHMVMDEHRVWQSWLKGDVKAIRDVCETAVLNTYLVYLNWQRNRGRLDLDHYDRQCQRVRENLKNSNQPQLIEFEKNWIDL